MAEKLRLASVEVTRRCDNHCAYCDQPKTEEDMPVGAFAQLCAGLREEGFDAVAVGGGEPTLHPALPALLAAAREQGLRAGLTTNSRDPEQVLRLAAAGLLQGFGVSAGKGRWLELAGHPSATVNLLLLRGASDEVLRQALAALRAGARSLLLLGYKGERADFMPATAELAETYSLLAGLGRRAGASVALDDAIRRRLGLAETCGQGFLRIAIDGSRHPCCFPSCEYYHAAGR